MLNLLREATSLFKLLGLINKNNRDIVFYAEDKASYSYFEGLIDELTNRDKLTIHYVTSEINDPVFKSKNKRIVAHYIKNLLFLFTTKLDSKLLIMTMPDLHQLHVKRSTRGAHHLYIFHNIGSSFPVIRFGALFYYDTIFCSGPHHNEEIRRQEELYDLNKKNLVQFGYYKLDKIYDKYRKYKKENPDKNRTKYKARILLGPSWGDNSILNLCGERLVKILLDSGFEVVVRPHPMTRKETPKVLDSLSKEFANKNGFKLDEDISSVDALFNSDILICDWSGLTFEYAFGTERPVLFIDVPQKIVNERYKEVGIEAMDVSIRKRLGAILGLDELERAGTVLTDMIDNKDLYTEEIKRAREEFVYNFKNSSKAGATFIKDFLAGKTAN